MNGGIIIKNKSIIILLITVIFISSIAVINAQEIDENQTTSLELEITNNSENNPQEVLSAPASIEPNLESSADQNPKSNAYLVLDNDADKENIYIGDYVTWILEAQNFGPDVSKNVKIYDKLPKGLKYIKHTTTKGTFNPKTGIWDIGDLSIRDGLVSLFITTKSITVGKKINEAYITSDTPNTNNETFEEEEIDVFNRNNFESSEFEKHVSAKMHETGNPIFLIFASLLILVVPIFKK